MIRVALSWRCKTTLQKLVKVTAFAVFSWRTIGTLDRNIGLWEGMIHNNMNIHEWRTYSFRLDA